jgi:hypothetical protein
VFRSLKESFDEADKREDVKAIVVTGMQSASEINSLLCMDCSKFELDLILFSLTIWVC